MVQELEESSLNFKNNIFNTKNLINRFESYFSGCDALKRESLFTTEESEFLWNTSSKFMEMKSMFNLLPTDVQILSRTLIAFQH